MDVEKWYLDVIQNHPGIAEELVVQGEELNKINPLSINTCRNFAFTIGDDVVIIGGAFRMGGDCHVTDNAGAGGIYSSVNTEYGILQSDAKNYNNQHYSHLPTTGTQIIGFQHPKRDEAKELIWEMSTHKHDSTLIYWDIAYSKDGWCMVEANDNGDWSLIQSNLEIGKKEQLYKLMDEYFNLTK